MSFPVIAKLRSNEAKERAGACRIVSQLCLEPSVMIQLNKQNIIPLIMEQLSDNVTQASALSALRNLVLDGKTLAKFVHEFGGLAPVLNTMLKLTSELRSFQDLHPSVST